MIRLLTAATGFESRRLASLLGISEGVLSEWLSGQRPVPESYLARLASIVGVSIERLTQDGRASDRMNGEVVPAIWFKMRSPELTDADRESVLLVRQLGFYLDELEDVTGKRSTGWEVLFETIRRAVDFQGPPRTQGRLAARIFREQRGLDQCAGGIGEAIRGNLRAMGVLVVETPVPDSKLEGCSFFVGTHHQQRPCVFANSHGSTWFRRNEILMHETGHAIFEAAQSGAVLDFSESDDEDVAEARADAFAQEMLLPASVLRHAAVQLGVNWAALSALDLAALVAATHVPQRTLVDAAREAGLLTPEEAQRAHGTTIAQPLKEMSEHALETREWALGPGREVVKGWTGKRHTTIPSRPLLLPVPYIKSVIDACADGVISDGRAAELLMIEEREFTTRFGEILEPVGA